MPAKKLEKLEKEKTEGKESREGGGVEEHLLQRVSSNEEEYKKIKSKVSELEKKNRSLEKENSKLKDKNSTLKNKIETVENKLNKVEKTSKGNSDKIDEIDKWVQQVHRNLIRRINMDKIPTNLPRSRDSIGKKRHEEAKDILSLSSSCILNEEPKQNVLDEISDCNIHSGD